MEYITKTISSEYDGLLLEALVLVPERKTKGNHTNITWHVGI